MRRSDPARSTNDIFPCRVVMCPPSPCTWNGGKACLLLRQHDHFTPTREITRHLRALARNHPEGWKLQGRLALYDELPNTETPSSLSDFSDNFCCHRLIPRGQPVEAKTGAAAPLGTRKVRISNVGFVDWYQSRGAVGHPVSDIRHRSRCWRRIRF